MRCSPRYIHDGLGVKLWRWNSNFGRQNLTIGAHRLGLEAQKMTLMPQVAATGISPGITELNIGACNGLLK